MNKTLFTYILIIGIAGTAGTTTGIVGKKLLGQEIIDYSGFNPELFRGDGKALLASYASDPKFIDKCSPADIVNIGLEKYRQCKNCYSIGTGVASTIVSQTIRNFQIKNNNKYFEESISYSSMVALANRAIQAGTTGDINLYKGKATGSESGSYPSEDKGTTYSQEKYKAYLGKTLNEMFIYLISNNSVVTDECEVKRTDNKGYQVKLTLHPDIATYYYKFQMKNISGLDGLPSFEYVRHTYTFDQYMCLETLHVDEKYTASMGVSVSITNSIDYRYYFEEYLEIPKNNESLDYSIGGSNNG